MSMLGLRRNPLSRSSRKSLASSTASDRSSLELPTPPAMDSIRSQEFLPATPVKPDVAVAVKEVRLSDSEESSRTESVTKITSQHQTLTRTTSSFKLSQVIEHTRKLIGRIISEIEDVDEEHFDNSTFSSYVEFIAEERLIHMPRKGSQWDRVLKAAEFFGFQIYNFGTIVADFVPESHTVASTALASCHLLLELGHNQAQALEPTFNALYELGLLLAQTLQKREFFIADELIKKDLAGIYSDLVHLVGEIAIYYRQRISRITTGTVTIDFDRTFGITIENIWEKKEHLWNHMWGHKLRHKNYSINIESLRHRLNPVDQDVKALLYGRLADKAERVEGTCEWIQPHLLDFFRSSEKTFTITGDAGFGKSVLAGWMTERLQRQLGRRSYETVSYTFPYDTPTRATPLAFLKNLLSQLLERNVGDSRLYETLVRAFENHPEHKDAMKLETALWSALEAGFKTIDEKKVNLVVIVDALDEVQGHDGAISLHKRLHNCIEKFSGVRAIVLSKPISHIGDLECKRLVITPEQVNGDIKAYLRQTLGRYHHFKSLDHASAEKFIESLVAKVKACFLEAYLASKYLATETSHDNFLKAGQTMPDKINGLLEKIVAKIDLKNTTTRNMLAFMLAAERPLTVHEMQDLLSVDLAKRTIAPIDNIRKHIATHCSILVMECNGLLRFKHASVRTFFKDELCGKALLSMKDAHTDLTKRMLLYAKFSLNVTCEPSFEIISGSVVSETFHSHGLLDYIVRNWICHFRSSTFYGAKDELNLSGEFKDVFPDSTFFAMIEWSCWQSQYSVAEAMNFHELTLRIRTACFGQKHHSVMQSFIIMGAFHQSMSNMVKAGECFYRASCIGQSVLYKFSNVVVTCTNYFLTCTEKIVITERTQIVTYREEMICFMIEICKVKYGASSDLVIKWYEVLAKLYIEIKEEHRATIIYKELYEIIIIRFGKEHPRVRHLRETLGGLKVVLNRGKNEEEVIKYDEFIFETSEEMEESDELRISIILRLCRTYEAHGKWILAERLYINLWRRISEICRVKATIELHIVKLNIAIEYVRFLQRIKHIEEATNILICLWAEYEHHSCDHETFILRIKEIGILFRTFGFLSIAVNVFNKVWLWFKGKGKQDHEEAVSTTIIITEVIEEITETTTTQKTTTTTTTTVTETVVREIFETTYTRCKHSKVDKHFFKACMALISLYIKQEKWSECEIVIKRSLELTWKAVLTVDAKLILEGTFIKETIIIATQLALCYHRQRYFEKAEEIYLRTYRACLHSFKIDHVCVTEASMALILFYEEYHRHDRVIEIYVELLTGYRKHCGASHELTIRTLYALGSICLTLGRKDAYQYYIEIVTVLNKGGHCHHNAFEAAFIVCRYYYETKQWVELRKICAVLWETFIHHHHEFKFTEEMIITLYERYVYVLEFHAKVEVSVLYNISVEYRETVTKCFGISAAIVIAAMIALAQICERQEEHWHESVTIYEEVIRRQKTVTTTTTTTVETTVTTVKKRLSKLYVTIITKGKTSTTVTFERAIAIAFEIYEHLKIEFGCWHEKTLIQLRELVLVHKKHNTKESHSIILRLLQAAVIEILTKVTTSIILYQAAGTLAGIYVSVGMGKEGQDLLYQLHHLIVLHDLGSATEITITIGHKVSKVAFVFLIAFEQRLTVKIVTSYSEVLADILLETYLYEQYLEVIKNETKIEVIFEMSAKLRSFWYSRGRKGQCEILDKKLFALFKQKYGSIVSTHSDITFIFCVALLIELGKERSHVDFGHITCMVSYNKVKTLLEAGEFHKALEVAKCSFQFIRSQRWYHSMHNVSHGYKLAELMAGIDIRKPTDTKLRESMLETSRQIVGEVLASCRAAKVNFVALKFEDVAGLVRLLGDQQNYGELEFLLEQLWNSREVQRTWSTTTVISIGRSLVHAHYAAGHVAEAIELCDTLCYNLRRSHGWLAPDTLAASKLLAELFTAAHRYRDAMSVHEEILREIDEDASAAADNHEPEVKVLGHKQDCLEHVELLKRSHQRLGGWEKNAKSYQDLYTHLHRFKIPGPSIDHWPAKGTADSLGSYTIPREWQLIGTGNDKKDDNATKRPGLLKAVSRRSYGGFGFGQLVRQEA